MQNGSQVLSPSVTVANSFMMYRGFRTSQTTPTNAQPVQYILNTTTAYAEITGTFVSGNVTVAYTTSDIKPGAIG